MIGGLLFLGAVSVAAIIYLLVNPYFSGERRTDKRIQSVTENRARLGVGKVQAEIAQNRKRQVAETLEELEQREKARTKVTLRLRLERAGLEITPRSFWLASVGCGVLVGLGIFASAPNLPILVP